MNRCRERKNPVANGKVQIVRPTDFPIIMICTGTLIVRFYVFDLGARSCRKAFELDFCAFPI